MILEASADSSVFVRGATAAILYLHIVSGGVGILAGVAALILRKGGSLHRAIGRVFLVSMLIMSTIGAAVSPFLPKPQWANVFMGVLTFFLVITSWMTVRRKEGSIGLFERGAFAIAMIVALTAFAIGVALAFSPTHTFDDLSVEIAALFATLWALVATAELRMIRRGGVKGSQRVVRHLWRMCMALLIAVMSLFLGQARLFPEVLRGTGVLFIPAATVAAMMLYWLIRMRRSKTWQSAARLG